MCLQQEDPDWVQNFMNLLMLQAQESEKAMKHYTHLKMHMVNFLDGQFGNYLHINAKDYVRNAHTLFLPPSDLKGDDQCISKNCHPHGDKKENIDILCLLLKGIQ